MLGKRTRGNTVCDDAQQAAKRPVVVLGASTKPGLAVAATPAKRLAAAATGAPAMSRSLSQKENQTVQPPPHEIAEGDVFTVDESVKTPAPAAYTLSPPPAEPRPVEVKSEEEEPIPARIIPHIYAHAASLLATSSDLASTLPISGRQDQRETLLAFLQRRFPPVYAAREGGSNGCSSTPSRPGPAAMYVSGPPGIGKTALLSAVLSDFERQIAERELGTEVVVLMENCAAIAAGGTGGDKAWEKLAAGLAIDFVKTDDSGRILTARQRFEEGLQDGRKYLLVLDEIDHLISPSTPTRPASSAQPDLLNALFQLASIPASPLTLIGIANDLTLKALSLAPPPLAFSPSPEKGKGKADTLRTPTKPIRLHFKPYSWQELVHIVGQRLSLLVASYPFDLDVQQDPPAIEATAQDGAKAKKMSFPLIDKPALERCAKKIAAGTGDVRTMLDVVRRAVAAVAHQQAALPEVSLPTFTPQTAPKAGMKHVSAALASSSGLTVAPTLAARLAALQGGPHQRLVLVAIVVALSRLEKDGAGLASLASSSTSPVNSVAPRVIVDECYKVYRDFVKSEDVLKPSALDTSTFVETVGMIEDLGGFVTVRGRPGSSPSSSPSKSGGGATRRLTPTKKHERGRVTVELSASAPMADLVAVMTTAPPPGREADEDEIARIARRLLERERSAQRWEVKRRVMGRDEDRRAEEELEGREWERSLQAAEVEGPSSTTKN